MPEKSIKLRSYPKILNTEHRYVKQLFDEPCIVEEKIDGSQFSFGLIDGKLYFRSKGVAINPDVPHGMFMQGVEAIKELHEKIPLIDGYTYRGEYLKSSKHNVRKYDRIPKHHVIIFDIDMGHQDYMAWSEKSAEADRIGLETVPLLFSEKITPDVLKSLMDSDSVLGGKIEGVVIKRSRNYPLFGADGKAVIAKYVSAEFKEEHAKSPQWKKQSKPEMFAEISAKYSTETRWRKAVQRLREADTLVNAPQDIPNLIQEVFRDIEEESMDSIKEDLYAYHSKNLRRAFAKGIPEWWKKELRGEFHNER